MVASTDGPVEHHEHHGSGHRALRRDKCCNRTVFFYRGTACDDSRIGMLGHSRIVHYLREHAPAAKVVIVGPDLIALKKLQ